MKHPLKKMMDRSPHTFHIPVMGTGFTIDTPLKVARYGISSVVSLVDDVLIEQVRKFHCRNENLPYEEIGNEEPDSRARRITAYLDFLHERVQVQSCDLQASPFSPNSEITRYFEMLPECSLRQEYQRMLSAPDPHHKRQLQDELRKKAVPGSIDVNIMTKLDRPRYKDGQMLPPEFSDALAALRGYGKTSLESSIVFSAGLNPRLYSYASRFEDFFPNQNGILKKKIILKVSDYRSAEIQGRFLAKKGLWVSEYRIESGLNCGGHAFATPGFLMGPILEEFKRKREELHKMLEDTYWKALAALNWPFRDRIDLEVRITAQGGIGTWDEDQFLLEHYGLDGTGWGTPFLLVPEVTNVDDGHLGKLASATESDVYLSDSSPLGIPFWTLRGSQSEEARRRRILDSKPGSVCPKGFLAFNTEFTRVPICTASRAYQKIKLQELSEMSHADTEYAIAHKAVISKACICHDLGGGATGKYGIDSNATTAVCCGPNIANFSEVATLQQMVGHIYGRLSLITNPDRQHMFIQELKLYLEHFRRELGKAVVPRLRAHLEESFGNLSEGIKYYRKLAQDLEGERRERFVGQLNALCAELLRLAQELREC